MGLVLQALSYFGTLSAFLSLTLAIACGLYILSEQVEAHLLLAKLVLKRSIYGIIAIHILILLFDSSSLTGSSFLGSLFSGSSLLMNTLFSVFANVMYLQLMKRFPFISLTSLSFLVACVSVPINHYLWYHYFTSEKMLLQHQQQQLSFAEVASFLCICVWLVPFALFISLSASDNNGLGGGSNGGYYNGMGNGNGLGNSGGGFGGLSIDISAAEKAKRKSTGLAKSIIGACYQGIFKVARMCGYELDPSYGRIV